MNETKLDWAIGDRVLARWPIENEGVYAATIIGLRDRELLLAYDDGSRCWLDISQVAEFRFWEGMVVSGRWQGGPYYYQGNITSIRGNAIFVEYVDGDSEWTIPALLRLAHLPEKLGST